MKHSNGYLLCRPRGGLNDILCQIDHCLDYARRYGRILVIDSRASGLGAPAREYFEVQTREAQVCLELNDVLLEVMEGLPTHPPGVGSCLEQYQIRYDRNGVGIDTRSGEPLTFNVKRNYSQERLVHEQCGGSGTRSSLEALKLTDSVADVVFANTDRLREAPYSAVHVRHSDLQTSYKTLFDELYTTLSGHRVVVCTDSAEVVEYAAQKLNNSDIVGATKLPDNHSGQLHYDESGRQARANAVRHEINLQLLTDQCIMAYAQDLFFTHVKMGFDSESAYRKHRRKVKYHRARDWLFRRHRGESPYTRMERGFRYSGFLKLALYLRKNPIIRDRFFNHAS